jgi:Fur family peroxide stress response transcriptional regulator
MMKVSPEEKRRRMDYFQQKCKQYGFPLTPQKVAIFEYLSATTFHPTAEEVYHHVKNTFPTLSLATIYKNLRKLKSLGIVSEIAIAGNTSRYDARLDNHHHAIYPDGRIVDVELDDQKIPVPDGVRKEDVSKISVNFYLSPLS